ncbi:hypothetical protein Leryth_013897 [Lithospermum erythrorhizon]|nr:hypothetical protein Leryth_013897 [Lithospermum erythrorhizon]
MIIGSFSEGENGNLRASDGGSLRVTEGGDCNLKVFEGKDGNLRVSEGGNGNLRVSEVKVGDLRGSEGDNLRDFVVKDGNLSLSEGNDSSFRVLVGGNCNLRASEGGNLSVFEGGDCNLMVSEGKDCNLRVSEVKYGNLSVSKRKDCNLRVSEGADGNLRGSSNLECVMNEVEMENVSEGRRDCGGESSSRGKEWWFVGSTDVLGMSTCKGRILKVGEQVNFYFPEKKNVLVSAKFGGGRGRQAANPDIVRFSTIACGEIGRIPNDWARCLLPLVRDKKVDIVGHCKSAPNVLGIMDTIVLTISVYINSSMFRKMHQILLKAASESVDESVVHPLPTLFRLLELAPFRKAEFTPGDLFTRKRPLSSADSSTLPSSILHLNKCQSSSTTNGDSENEESISDNDLDRIVGVTEDTQLEEMDPPSTLQCGLRPYQKQALHWMVQLERGQCTDDASTTLHPCWAAFHLADKRGLDIYLNAFSGDATIEFPSTLQMAKGGILADSMGLGKTIMTISLLLTHSERSRSVGSQSPGGTNEAVHGTDESSMTPKTLSKFSGFRKLARRKGSLTGGGNLIICPMTLIGQWKAEIETHAQPGSLSVYVHYGQNRSKDAHALAQYDVILTTYGVLASEYSTENAEDCGGLYSIRWFRVVLDEAHTIKSSKSQISAAAAALIADRRWCLTGTPIQNKLEDIFSLLRFLRVEPWRSWAWWNKLVQKPFEEGDEALG